MVCSSGACPHPALPPSSEQLCPLLPWAFSQRPAFLLALHDSCLIVPRGLCQTTLYTVRRQPSRSAPNWMRTHGMRSAAHRTSSARLVRNPEFRSAFALPIYYLPMQPPGSFRRVSAPAPTLFQFRPACTSPAASLRHELNRSLRPCSPRLDLASTRRVQYCSGRRGDRFLSCLRGHFLAD